ncbi:MAG TPA: hypothetical protein PKH80_06695 [Methanofastidiosum sp.]|nr:hypothetical protein [Methanofastidiosum sp.]HNU61077.1 hypothetical protein [Methanofastidiosum sp.]
MDTDIVHPKGAHIEWNESFYFSFYDKVNDICAFMRIGLKPNKPLKNMFCFFMLPDGSYIGLKEDDRYENDILSAKNLTFHKIQSEKKWNLTFDGKLLNFSNKKPVDVSFNLDFESLNKIFDYRDCVSGFKEKISQSVASEHLEQFGKATGELKVSGNQYKISGLGERDHSWGARDWNAPKMWIWLTCQFSEESALNVTKLTVAEGEVDAGFIHIGGENLPIVKATINTEYNQDGSPNSFEMKLLDKKGGLHKIDAKIIKNVKLPFTSGDGKKQSIMHETLTEYKMDGKTGYGIAEYLIRDF